MRSSLSLGTCSLILLNLYLRACRTLTSATLYKPASLGPQADLTREAGTSLVWVSWYAGIRQEEASLHQLACSTGLAALDILCRGTLKDPLHDSTIWDKFSQAPSNIIRAVVGIPERHSHIDL